MGNFKVAIKVIIKNEDDKILVLKRSSTEDCFENLWDLPGGRMEFTETPTDAIKREVMEETGLIVEINKPFTVWSFMAKEDLQVVGVTFISKYISGEVVLSEEHTEYKWINPEEFIDFDSNKNLKKEILKYAEEK